jgi:hypothetical protein
VTTALVLGAASMSAQQAAPKGKDEKKMDKAQQAEIQGLMKVADQVAAGQPAPNDIPFTLENHFLKARDTRTYVPFIITIDPAKVTTPSLAMYLRVVKKGAADAAAAPSGKDAKKDENTKKNGRPEYAFEDVYFVDPKAETGQPYRVQRAFAAAGGDYDVYLALKERTPAATKNPPPAKITVYKQALTVPDYWNNELATSSIILADKVDQLTTPYTEAQQAEHPYTFGMTQIVPSPDNKFTKKENLSIIFLVYNTAPDANKKPDVTVDYNFYLKNADGTEKFFNKTNPQVFNASTLPPQFDQAAGHQLVAGQEVPLASFPEGTFRLEIKVTDKLSNKSLTQNLAFSVTAG